MSLLINGRVVAKPILPKIDLKIYEYEKVTPENKTVSLAKEYFGDDKVIIKE